MLLLAEKDTVLSLERKQYDIESQREKTRGLYLREKLKVEELRAKYEPGKHIGGYLINYHHRLFSVIVNL